MLDLTELPGSWEEVVNLSDWLRLLEAALGIGLGISAWILERKRRELKQQVRNLQSSNQSLTIKNYGNLIIGKIETRTMTSEGSNDGDTE